MGDVLVGDVVKVTAQFTWDDTETFQNVYYVKHAGSATATDIAFHNACAAWLETLYTPLLSYLSTKLDFDEVVTYNVTQDIPMITGAWPTLTQGSDAGDPLPTQCSALVSFPTAKKKVIGKKYIAGATETNNLSGGILSSAFKTALASFGAAVLSGYVSGTIVIDPGTYNVITGVFNELLTSLVDDLFRTQRRRVKGVGA